MDKENMSRRAVLKGGGAAALVGLTVLRVAGPASAFSGKTDGSGGEADSSFAADDESQGQANESLLQPGETVIPWLDQPAPNPVPEVVGHPLVWEKLHSWLTPNDEFFTVKHYNQPAIAEAGYHLDIGGLVSRPLSLTLAGLKARARRAVYFTLECSGNTGLPFFIGGVGNARWVGTPLASLLRYAGVGDDATEVIFWGADAGQVAIRDDSGILSGGNTGSVVPDTTGGLDLTITEQFARSMTLADAMNPNNLLCYEMNGAPLPPEHGYPVRLIAPGWYGVANVKWLTNIEVTDHRYTGRFMARDYVTIREEVRGGKTVWTFANVGHERLKSAPAKVTRRGGRYAILAAAWGAPVARLEVSIDNGPWQAATLKIPRPSTTASRRIAWSFWTLDWGTPSSGEHTITSRAFGVDGNVQPAPEDPFLAAKRTYWEANGQITRRVLIA
jgi:DMSO/TMAO reductase YedYZ molybdopterin-dependent catalytic subunit